MNGNLKGLGSRAIIGGFYKRLEEVQQMLWTPQITSVFSSNQEIEIYPFLNDAPKLRRVTSGYGKTTLREQEIQIRNEKYGSILEVKEEDMRRDKTGQIMVRVNERAARAAQLPAQLISNMINENGNAYDGVAFFHATNHVTLNGDVVANAITFNATTSTELTTAEGAAASLKAIEKILGFKDDEGEPRNEFAKSFTIMCPENLLSGLTGGARNDYVTNGESNTLKISGFNVNVVSNPRLTDASKFFVFRSDGDVKAFIWQDEVEPEMTDRTPENSDAGFERDVYLFKVRRIGNGHYGRFDQACQVTLT